MFPLPRKCPPPPVPEQKALTCAEATQIVGNQIDDLKAKRQWVAENADRPLPFGRDAFTMTLMADMQERAIQDQLKFMRQAGCAPPPFTPDP